MTAHEATQTIWAKYAKTCGARFRIERKAEEAIRFCLDKGVRSFAVPSKLEGTSKFQENIVYAQTRLDRYSRKLMAEITEEGRVAIGFGMYRLGFIQSKHECWVRPLVESGYVLFYLLQVTGGAQGKPTRGVNICIYNLAEAIQHYAAQMEPKAFARLVA